MRKIISWCVKKAIRTFRAFVASIEEFVYWPIFRRAPNMAAVFQEIVVEGGWIWWLMLVLFIVGWLT